MGSKWTRYFHIRVTKLEDGGERPTRWFCWAYETEVFISANYLTGMSNYKTRYRLEISSYDQ